MLVVALRLLRRARAPPLIGQVPVVGEPAVREQARLVGNLVAHGPADVLERERRDELRLL